MSRVRVYNRWFKPRDGLCCTVPVRHRRHEDGGSRWGYEARRADPGLFIRAQVHHIGAETGYLVYDVVASQGPWA